MLIGGKFRVEVVYPKSLLRPGDPRWVLPPKHNSIVSFYGPPDHHFRTDSNEPQWSELFEFERHEEAVRFARETADFLGKWIDNARVVGETFGILVTYANKIIGTVGQRQESEMSNQ